MKTLGWLRWPFGVSCDGSTVSNQVLQQRTIHFAGAVQGVGFRYKTERLATNYPVTGYVRNLENGQVKLVVEGASDDIESFLVEIRASFAGNIRDEKASVCSMSGHYRAFEIRP